MHSPFPGMDPFLEGHLWPDVHHGLAFVFKELIAPQVSPGYIVNTEIYTLQDAEPEEDVGILYPDVEVLRRVEEPAGAAISPSPATLSVPSVRNVEVRIPVVEIRDRKKNKLITAIEILSPVNKRSPGLQPNIEKRNRLHAAGVHLLEIDLIRRGRRPFNHPYVPKSHYLVTLMRAGVGKTDVWAFNVQDTLPVLPVPLKSPDPDALLDLRRALDLIYERSLYQLSIDYQKDTPAPPAFSEAEMHWVRSLA